MQIFTLEQAFNMAGIDRDDDPWVRDLKLAAWTRGQKWAMVGPNQQAPNEALDILIIKGEVDVTEP